MLIVNINKRSTGSDKLEGKGGLWRGLIRGRNLFKEVLIQGINNQRRGGVNEGTSFE